MKKQLSDIHNDIVSLRHHIHQHPELQYEEELTAALVAKTLTEYGYQVTTGIGETGVTTILDSGKPGKTVALRADMDALPLNELTDLAYKSQYQGIMHACGHDGHTATLLAVAQILREHTDKFTGKIKFIFQPAEEGGAGAAEMIHDGVLTDPSVDAIFAYHNMPSLPFGQIYTRTGCIMGAQNAFDLKIVGKGGHAAIPDQAIDPIYIATLIIQQLQGIVSRLTKPTDPCVLSVTEFHAGSAGNIIPEEADLRLTLRTANSETQQYAISMIHSIVNNIADIYGAHAELAQTSEYPATINTAAEVALIQQTASQLFGDACVKNDAAPIMTAEDFSYFLEEIPGCYVLIGMGESKPMCHSSYYDFDDRLIPIAAELLANTAINYLNQGE